MEEITRDTICLSCGKRLADHGEDPLNGQALCEDGQTFTADPADFEDEE